MVHKGNFKDLNGINNGVIKVKKKLGITGDYWGLLVIGFISMDFHVSIFLLKYI